MGFEGTCTDWKRGQLCEQLSEQTTGIWKTSPMIFVGDVSDFDLALSSNDSVGSLRAVPELSMLAYQSTAHATGLPFISFLAQPAWRMQRNSGVFQLFQLSPVSGSSAVGRQRAPLQASTSVQKCPPGSFHDACLASVSLRERLVQRTNGLPLPTLDLRQSDPRPT